MILLWRENLVHDDLKPVMILIDAKKKKTIITTIEMILFRKTWLRISVTVYWNKECPEMSDNWNFGTGGVNKSLWFI